MLNQKKFRDADCAEGRLKIVVIGAGAAGMMAAGTAAANGADVLVLEKNEKPGRKLNITGKGRCNVTNNTDVEGLLQHVLTNPRFLNSAFYTMDSYAVMDFFESRGVKLKTERGGRVFPESEKAADITAALVEYMKSGGVKVNYKTIVSDIRFENEKFFVEAGGNIFESDSVIITTGGLSYPGTGSTGDGYVFAKKFGHKIIPTSPSLVAINTAEKWVSELEGLSLKNVKISVIDKNEKVLYEELGEMMFTFTGVTGPLILKASAVPADGDKSPTSNYKLCVDLKPALTFEQLDKRILRDFSENKNKNYANALGDLLPKRLISTVVRLSGISPERKINAITKEERHKLVGLIKYFYLTPVGTAGYKEAVITKGGVDVREINPSTLMSKKIPNLFFAGEVLDVDALTGGYNLQIAFSTGFLAGISASN